jgi:VanZ family protein
MSSSRTKKFIFLYISIIVIIITLIPIPKKIQTRASGWDKFVHFSIFSVLGFFAQAALSLFALLYGALLAVITELLQKFIPGRTPDIADFSTNMMGVIIGTSFWELVRKRT